MYTDLSNVVIYLNHNSVSQTQPLHNIYYVCGNFFIFDIWCYDTYVLRWFSQCRNMQNIYNQENMICFGYTLKYHVVHGLDPRFTVHTINNKTKALFQRLPIQWAITEEILTYAIVIQTATAATTRNVLVHAIFSMIDLADALDADCVVSGMERPLARWTVLWFWSSLSNPHRSGCTRPGFDLDWRQRPSVGRWRGDAENGSGWAAMAATNCGSVALF